MSGFLDIRTLSLVAGLNSIALASIMVYISMSRRVYPGFHRWAWAFVVGGLGMLLLSLRHLVPDWLSILGANGCIVAFVLLLSMGVSQFFQAPGRLWFHGTTFAAFMAALAYYTYQHPNVTARIVSISLAVSVMLFHILVLLLRHTKSRLGSNNNLLNVVFAFMATWYLARAVITPLCHGPISDFLSAGTLQGFSFIVYALGCVMIMGGLVTLNAQRMENELASADQNIETLERLVPICSACKKIRDDKGYWEEVESYIHKRTADTFTHGICPECAKKLYPDLNIYGK